MVVLLTSASLEIMGNYELYTLKNNTKLNVEVCVGATPSTETSLI